MVIRELSNVYQRSVCAVVYKTKEKYGALSNMAGGYPLLISGVAVPSSEALYQALRFPHLPDVQTLILSQSSPMASKMVSKPYRQETRPDWDEVRVPIMAWCLRQKADQHRERFGTVLSSTEEKAIVEESRRDDFWGAKPVGTELLVGTNILGKLLMALREELRQGTVAHPQITEMLLLGRNIPLENP